MSAALSVVEHAMGTLELAVIAVVVSGWLDLAPPSRLARAGFRFVRKCLDGIRRGFPTTVGAVDASPIVLVFILEVIRSTLGSIGGGSG